LSKAVVIFGQLAYPTAKVSLPTKLWTKYE